MHLKTNNKTAVNTSPVDLIELALLQLSVSSQSHVFVTMPLLTLRIHWF